MTTLLNIIKTTAKVGAKAAAEAAVQVAKEVHTAYDAAVLERAVCTVAKANVESGLSAKLLVKLALDPDNMAVSDVDDPTWFIYKVSGTTYSNREKLEEALLRMGLGHDDIDLFVERLEKAETIRRS